MSKKKILDDIRIAVLEGDDEIAEELAKQALEAGIGAIEIMDGALALGIQEAGNLYEEGEYFLPDLVCSADAMKLAIEVIQPELDKLSDGNISKGKVLIATVQGDIHDIGKTIVSSMLTSAGYTVYDLGCDVKNELVIQQAKEKDVDIVALSALLTTTMQEQKNIINTFKEDGVNVKVMIGGAPVTQEFADIIGADGYSENAVEAVQLANRLMAG